MKKTRLPKKNLKLKKQSRKAQIKKKHKKLQKINQKQTTKNQCNLPLSSIPNSIQTWGAPPNDLNKAINFWRQTPFWGKFSIFFVTVMGIAALFTSGRYFFGSGSGSAAAFFRHQRQAAAPLFF